jgi:hypothetical protein
MGIKYKERQQQAPLTPLPLALELAPASAVARNIQNSRLFCAD